MDPKEIIEFWFGKDFKKNPLKNAKDWFTKNPDFDEEVREQFLPTLQKIAAGEYADWNLTAEGSMAYILVTDQFPRNMFRNLPESFQYDPLALTVARHGVAQGFDQELSWIERSFYYLPFEHTEDLETQETSLLAFQNLQRSIPKQYMDHGDEVYDYAIKHWEIIKQFGRFPHRNLILQRESTPEEIAFLKNRIHPFNCHGWTHPIWPGRSCSSTDLLRLRSQKPLVHLRLYHRMYFGIDLRIMQGAWPFGVVEIFWTVIAFKRWLELKAKAGASI